jgi:hypothetical protein
LSVVRAVIRPHSDHMPAAVSVRATKSPVSGAFPYGRYWARNRQAADQLSEIWNDFEPLLQGLLVDAEGRPISLSATGLHCALGRIRDLLAASGGVGRITELLLHEVAGRVSSRTRDEADA